jgi:hypothetical protein
MPVVPHGTSDLVPTGVNSVQVNSSHGSAGRERHVLVSGVPVKEVAIKGGVLRVGRVIGLGPLNKEEYLQRER